MKCHLKLHIDIALHYIGRVACGRILSDLQLPQQVIAHTVQHIHIHIHIRLITAVKPQV